MPIYIYRGGSNPGPQNPLVRLLISIAVLAGLVALGVLLLPVIGVVALLILGLIVVLVVGGFIYRAMYGDPLQQMKKNQQDMHINPNSSRPFSRGDCAHQPKSQRAHCARFRATSQEVEDAVVVEEKHRNNNGLN